MEFTKNIKISAEFLSNQPLTHFFDIAAKRNVYRSLERNILVIKDNFSLTVFRKAESHYHFNVSGIKTIAVVDTVIEWLTKTYCNKTDFV